MRSRVTHALLPMPLATTLVVGCSPAIPVPPTVYRGQAQQFEAPPTGVNLSSILAARKQSGASGVMLIDSDPEQAAVTVTPAHGQSFVACDTPCEVYLVPTDREIGIQSPSRRGLSIPLHTPVAGIEYLRVEMPVVEDYVERPVPSWLWSGLFIPSLLLTIKSARDNNSDSAPVAAVGVVLGILWTPVAILGLKERFYGAEAQVTRHEVWIRDDPPPSGERNADEGRAQ